MKKTGSIMIVSFLIGLMTSPVLSWDKSAVDEKIKDIAAYLDKPGGPGSDGKIMFSLLLEAILEAAPETDFPPEFSANMEKAKQLADSTSIFNPDGIVYLHKAYRLINGGEDFIFPESINEIQDAANYIRMELAASRKNIRVDQMESCIKGLLKVAIMIVTPMHH